MTSPMARALLLFDDHVELPEAERLRALERLKAEDPALHDALVALLAGDANDGVLDAPRDLLARLTPAGEAADPRIGTRVGVWRLVGVLGYGGMGTVYAAERDDGQYRQSGALKYIRSDLVSPGLVAAFHRERDVLASLAHPGIAPLLDGGVDAAGQPWFVMQRVEGQAIDRWCDQAALSVHGRVELFLQACDAVSFVHGHGVLHQDIKPSNLLVTAQGWPQLLDFGLSAFSSDGDEGYRRIAATAGYAAPEVMRGAPPSIAIDIYALGVLLYRLLCDQEPGGAPRALTAVQAPHAPRRCSELALSLPAEAVRARGETSAKALSRRLAGDLDSIALRCVATDPAARYASVAALRDDLRLWLQGRPVAARGGGMVYRAGKFLRRHRLATVLAGGLALSLGAGVAVVLWQHQWAWREMRSAQLIAGLFEQTLGTATLSRLGDMPLTSSQLLERTEQRLREHPLATEPDALARGLSLLARSRAATGDYARAERLAREAGVVGRDNALQDAFNQATLAYVWNLQARHPQAQAAAERGLARLRLRLTDQHELAWMRLQTQRALALSGQGRSPESLAALNAAIDRVPHLDDPTSSLILAQLLVQRGTWYRLRMRLDESDADLQRAIGLAERAEPRIADDARESLLRTIRLSRKPGREARALAMAQALLDSRREHLGPDHPQTGSAWVELAYIQMLNNDYPAAGASVERGMAILLSTLGDNHPATARAHMARANLATAVGDADGGIREAQRALDIYQRSHGPMHEYSLDARFLLASRYWFHPEVQSRSLLGKAEAIMASAIDDSVARHGTVAAIHRLAYGAMLGQLDRLDASEREIVHARQDALRQYGADSPEMLHVRSAEVGVLIRAGREAARVEAALASLERDTRPMEGLYPQSILYDALLKRAQWEFGRQRAAQGFAALQEAREVAGKAGQQPWVDEVDVLLAEHRRSSAGD